MRKDNHIRKGLAVAVILLFTGVAFAPSINATTTDLDIYSKTLFDGNTLYVGGTGPGNYTRIQDAIDDATDGDTVFVYDDSSPYYENVIVDRSINLIGEDKHSTIIDAREDGTVTCITANSVNITGFTIQKGGLYPWPDKIYAGIDIYGDFAFISNNLIISNKDRGINICSSSSNNIISDNTISSNGGASLYITHSKDNTILENTITNNEGDIYLLYSNNNILSENTFINNSLSVFSSYQNTINNNMVNGKPLIYLEEESDQVIVDDAGQIILVKCDNITVQNQEISGTCAAIHLLETNNCLISDNVVTNNKYGIELDFSNLNTISENTISFNERNGIDFYSSSNNVISENAISSNNEYGIGIYSSSNNNTIFCNNVGSNKRYGISLISSNDNIVSYNTISSNIQHGVVLYDGSNTVSNNSFLNDGLFVSSIQHNIVTNNTVNGKDLIYLEEESNKVIDGNAGQVILMSCDNIIVKNQNISNTDIGIMLLSCKNCVIQGNNINSNNGHGIFLFLLCSDNNISGNSIISNDEDGICIRSSYQQHSIKNTIFCNTISLNNQYGIYLDGSSDDTSILANTITSNKAHGIYIRVSINNSILENHIEKNAGGIILVGSVDNVITHNNFIKNKINAFFADAISIDPPFFYGKSKWLGNYWNRPRLLPKPIFGIMAMIPWLNFDWRPAREPYEIC